MMKTIMMMFTGGVTCEKVDEGLDDFLDGEMSFLKRMRFRMHFAACKACSAYLAAYRQTIQLVKDSFDRPDADSVVDEALVNSILDAQDRSNGGG